VGPPTSVSGALLSGVRQIVSWLKTAQGRHEATFGRWSIVSSTGDVVNISRKRDRLIIGENCVISGQLQVFAHAGRIRIGDWVFVGQGSRLWSSAELVVGNRVLISHNVEIHDTESHPLDAEARAAQTRDIFKRGHPKTIEGIRSAPIRTGNDVWIGFGATVRKGVTIGDRAIIGARAIVDRDVPADSVVRVSATPPTSRE
jgi:acetyltransferase-like isoleucine patch superfamily enzyme